MTTRKRGSRGETEKEGRRKKRPSRTRESRSERSIRRERVRKTGGIETESRRGGRWTEMEGVRAGTRDRRRPLVTPDTQPSPRQFRPLKSLSTVDSMMSANERCRSLAVVTRKKRRSLPNTSKNPYFFQRSLSNYFTKLSPKLSAFLSQKYSSILT